MAGFSEPSKAAYRAAPPTHFSNADFNLWIDRQEAKFGWKKGRVVQMSNVSKAHARIASNLLFAIRRRRAEDQWSVTASDLGVEDEDFIRFPDIIVEPMDDDDKARHSRAPVLLAEVLSPSSIGIDFTESVRSMHALLRSRPT